MGQDGQPSTLKIDVGGVVLRRVKSSIKQAAASCLSLYKDALLTLTLSLIAFIAGQYINTKFLNEILVIFFILVHNRHVFTSTINLMCYCFVEIGIMLEKTCAGCLCSR